MKNPMCEIFEGSKALTRAIKLAEEEARRTRLDWLVLWDNDNHSRYATTPLDSTWPDGSWSVFCCQAENGDFYVHPEDKR